MQTLERPAPAPSTRTKRLTDELRNLPINPWRAIVLDPPTCKAFRAYAKSRSWIVTQQAQQDGTILVWRIA